MRDDQRGPPGQRGLQRGLHRDLGLRVQVRGGLVQHHHRRRLEQQPGDGQPLLLARRTAGSRGPRPPCPARRAARRSAPRSAPPGTPRSARPRWPPAGRSCRLARIVSWNMCASWVTTPTASCSESRVTSRRSWPPMRTAPSSGSYSRDTRWVIVVLPAPDGPTSAVSCPGGAWKVTSRSTGCAGPGVLGRRQRDRLQRGQRHLAGRRVVERDVVEVDGRGRAGLAVGRRRAQRAPRRASPRSAA